MPLLGGPEVSELRKNGHQRILLTVKLWSPRMEPLQHYLTMEAFCRQRAKMEGEDESFWLTEAELLATAISTVRFARVPTASMMMPTLLSIG